MQDTRGLDRELKKGSAELLVLSLVDARARHGYEIGKLIETRSGGMLRFNIASLYPLLYRLEKRGWLRGRWVEKPLTAAPDDRLTPTGRKVLAAQRAAGGTSSRRSSASRASNMPDDRAHQRPGGATTSTAGWRPSARRQSAARRSSTRSRSTSRIGTTS